MSRDPGTNRRHGYNFEMHVSLAVLADYALLDKADKLSIIGIFGQIGSAVAPIRHPKMTLVIVFESTRADYNRQRELEIDITDQDGKPIVQKISGQVGINGDPAVPPSVNIIINLEDVTFPDFGAYTVSIFLNGDIQKTVRLDVVKMDTPA